MQQASQNVLTPQPESILQDMNEPQNSQPRISFSSNDAAAASGKSVGASARWGEEDAAFLQAKAKKIAEIRAQTKKELSHRFTWKHAVATILGWLAYHRAANMLSVGPRKATVWLLVALLARTLWVNRAPKRLTPSKTILYHDYPILGQIASFAKGMKLTLTELQRVEGELSDYQSMEFVYFGNTRDLTIMDRDDREYILKKNWKNYTKNHDSSTSFDKIFPELLGRGIFAVDGDEWQDHRKIASHMFSANGLRTKMESSFGLHSALLTNTVDKLIDSSPDGSIVLDWQDTMQSFTFETICDIAFGMQPGALEPALLRDEKIPFLVAFDQLQTDSILRFVFPPFVTSFMRMFQLGYEKRLFENGQYVRGYVSDIIKQRLESSESVENQADLLSMYIRTSRATGKPWMESIDYLSDAVLNFMVAGRDTTSFTLIHLFEILAENKEVSDKLRAELDRVVGADRDVSWDDVRELPYCGAVFNEVLRLHPPVAADFRVTNADDTLPSGLVVPAGSRVFFPNIGIGRDYHLWSEPERFLPERWIDPEEPSKPVRRVNEYLHPVFYGGPRLCLGKDMARLEVLGVAHAVLKRFNVEIVPGQSKRVLDGPVSFYEHGLKVRLTRQEVDPARVLKESLGGDDE